MIDAIRRHSRRNPRLVVGIAALLVAAPFAVGAYGPAETEVHLWVFSMLAVGGALMAIAIGAPEPRPRWSVLVDLAAVALFVPAVMILSHRIQTEPRPAIETVASAMLVLAAVALAGRRRLGRPIISRVLAVLALLVATAQIPAIDGWLRFGRLTDAPDPTPFVTHWAYAIPHVVLGGLALWLAAAESGAAGVIRRRAARGVSPAG